MVVRLDTHDVLKNFSDMIGRVHDGGEIVVIERADKPMAVIVPVEFYERFSDMTGEGQIEPAGLREAIPMYRVGNMVDDAPHPRAAVRTARPSTQGAGTLAGAFPELAYLGDEDMDWAKQQWGRGLDKQIELLAKDASGH